MNSKNCPLNQARSEVTKNGIVCWNWMTQSRIIANFSKNKHFSAILIMTSFLTAKKIELIFTGSGRSFHMLFAHVQLAYLGYFQRLAQKKKDKNGHLTVENNLGKLYIWPKSIWKDLSLPVKISSIFLAVRNDVIIKMAEKCLFFAKIGYYTTLGHPISTNYTIFRNLRASLIHWTSLFWNLKSSKIQLCKGPPLEILISPN